MVLGSINPEPILNHDDFTTYTVTTPPETVAADPVDDRDPFGGVSSFLVPWPGSTYTIRSVSSGHVIMLLEGRIVLTQPQQGRCGSIDWECVELKGWLGFRNVVSGKFLGHDAKGRLCCSAEQQRNWERFCVRMRPEGGCVLFMTHWESLWHVGIEVEQGVEKLAKIKEGGSGGIVWEFHMTDHQREL